MNYSDYINFKWGSEPQGKIKRHSLAKKWMFIKPDVGNLSPSSQMPFSSFSVIPYFGGYPTGYSLYEYCAWSTPYKLKNNKLIGFTHFCFSGCGDLHHFHNYFLIKPCQYGTNVIDEKYALDGQYIKTKKYIADIKVNNRSAYYNISSQEEIVIIPGFNGLSTDKYKSNIVIVNIKQDEDIINVDADYGFLHLYWSIKLNKGEIRKITSTEITLSNEASFVVSFSIDSIIDANKYCLSFNDAMISSWEKLFNIFNINGEEKYKKLFYTSLMFALKKPYIYDEERVYDFATMWDIYKTLLPFIFLFYKKEASIIAKNMLKLVNKDGLFYHVNLFSSSSPVLSDQAICLINISLSTASLYGVEFNKELAKSLQRKEIEYYLNNLDKLDRTTYLLDLSDAIVSYFNAYNIDLGLNKVKELIAKAFESDKVYLNKKATYYEGNYSNYSFRVSSSTMYRIDNNKNEIIKALDNFFGFKGFNSIRFKKPTKPSIVKWYMKKCKRFEGLNNEPDMESMYLYSYLNEYGKQNKVVYDVINNSFSINNNGVPGNDDNGGLSTWLVFNLIGIFPVVGTDKIKIGLPFFDDIKINNLIIKKHYKAKDSYCIDKVFFNGFIKENKEITSKEINDGGVLDIYLK